MKKIIKKLPVTLQTPAQQKFFDATFEQLFQKKSNTEEIGYIGRRVGGRYDVNDDYYLPEYSNERQNYQLEPVVYTQDPDTLDDRNVMFYTDFLDYLKLNGALTNNHDRLFRSARYSYSPPIDVDKFINYQNYFWIPGGLPTLQVPYTEQQLLDYFIDNPSDTEISITNAGGNTLVLSSGMHVVCSDQTTAKILQLSGTTVELIEIDPNTLPIDQFSNLEWDNFFEPWDMMPWDAKSALGIEKDYITIQRGSIDKNGWSRTNRWYHKNVVFATISYLETVLPTYSVAQRPIIEFVKNLELYRSGTQFLSFVNYIESNPANQFDDINGEQAINVLLDGLTPGSGNRVFFPEGPDKGLYDINIEQNGEVTLIATGDVPVDGDIVISTDGQTPDNGGNRGTTWVYRESTDMWAQIDQDLQKTSENQPPKFNLYDSNNVSLEDEAIYPNSSFQAQKGSTIFAYKINEFSPVIDSELGFPLSFEGLGQINDIVFENTQFTERHSWTETPGDELIPISGYYYFNNLVTSEKSNGWYAQLKDLNGITQCSIRGQDYYIKNKQRVIDRFVVTSDGNNVFEVSIEPETLEVRYNGRLVDDYAVSGKIITLNISTKQNDVVEFFSWNKTQGLESREEFGYYEIPEALESNPLNDEVTEATQNKLSKHLVSIIENQEGVTGTGLSADNNYRDTAKDPTVGDVILQVVNPLPLAFLCSSSSFLDIVESIRFNKNEYTRYRNKFIKFARELALSGQPIANSDPLQVSRQFNEVIERMVEVSEFTQTFRNTYMFARGAYIESISTGLQASAVVESNVNIDDVENHLYVYLDGEHLVKNKDWYVQSNLFKSASGVWEIEIIFTPQIDGEVRIRVYPDMAPGYMPSSPTKLGMYPASKPERVLDTSYLEPMEVIVGHDGSRTPVTGNPVVDNLILELETRIYNGLAEEFADENYIPLLIKENVIPSSERITDYDKSEIVRIYQQNISKWANTVRANLYTNESYDPVEWKTWRYDQGSWREVYRLAYDTDTPWSTPWEMLGFNQKPVWWDTTYTLGIDPVTPPGVPNVWTDVAMGRIRSGSRAGIDTRFAKPNIIPVPAEIDPISLGITTVPSDPSSDWEIGDQGPAEYAWKTTEVYPFDIMELLFLSKPAEFGFTNWDTQQYKFSDSDQSQQVNRNTLLRSNYTDTQVHGEMNNDGLTVYKAGYQQWISDRLSFLNKNLTVEFGDLVRRLGVKLGHKVGGFTNPQTAELFLEATSAESTGNSLLIPRENINIDIHTAPPSACFSYSGVVIGKTNGGYIIGGYDLLEPTFKTLDRNPTGRKRQITVGGTNAAFRIYTSSSSYSVNEIVQYNGRYYQALKQIVAGDSFNPDDWVLLDQLPTRNGTSVSYISSSNGNITEYDYGHEFTTPQEVFDFLIGYGQYLESQGWRFDSVDNTNNKVQDWLTAGEDFLFWANTDWETNSTIRLSPGGFGAHIEISQGYFDNIGSRVNGVYNLLDEAALPIPNSSINVIRNNNSLQVAPRSTDRAIYLMRVYAIESEHRITIENETIFGDVVYSPLLGVRQNRLEFEGIRSGNWTGKKEAPGYIITDDNRLIPNFDTLAESIRLFQDTESRLDRPQIENVARHLIGFETREYMNNLDIRQDTQYQFYQGMIHQKGTIDTINKLSRSSRVSSDRNVELYEEFALKLSNFGGTALREEINLKIDSSRVSQNPQIVSLDYPESPSGSIKSIEIINSEYVYTEPPIVVITGDGTGANATATIGDDGRLSSIRVNNPGSGYTQEPSVSFLKQDNSPYTSNNDRAIAVLQLLISNPGNPQKIRIDFDDSESWLTKPNRAVGGTDLWPESQPVYLMPDSGFVLQSEVTGGTYFNEDDFIGRTIVENQTYHLARVNNLEWDIYQAIDRELKILENTGETITFTGQPYNPNGTFLAIEGVVYSYSGNGPYVIIDPATGLPVTPEVAPVGSSVIEFQSKRYSTRQEFTDDVDSGITGIVYINESQDNPSKWEVIRSDTLTRIRQQTLESPNSLLFQSSYLYESRTKDTLAQIYIYDPLRGLIPGMADQNIDIKLTVDPAKYTNSSDASKINNNLLYGPDEVGVTWLDMSSFAYVDYFQDDDLEYRRTKWGTLHPGSDPAVYEWTQSLQRPVDYEGEGTPRNTTDYTEVRVFDSSAGYEISYYYFWVRNKVSWPKQRPNRTMGIAAVEQLIRNPRAAGFSWLAPISANTFIFANLEEVIQNNNSVIQINYRTSDNEINDHREWYLMGEGRPASTVKDQHWRKLVDSLCGSTPIISEEDMPEVKNLSGAVQMGDSSNLYTLTVPDPMLSMQERVGNQFRPRQSMFIDVQAARKVFTQAVNELMSDINLTTQGINPSDTITTGVYWTLSTWYADGFTASDVEPKFIVNEVNEIATLISNGSAQNGDIVRVEPSTDPAFTVLVGTGVISQEQARFTLRDRLYQDNRLTSLRIEMREILQFLESVFANTLAVRKNKLFFAMINYVLSEQPDVDWIFKTTYVSIRQDGVTLDQKPILVNDPYDSFVKYINEVKPYHTKIRDYRNSFSSIEDVPIDIDDSLYTQRIKLVYNRTVPDPINNIIDANAFADGIFDFNLWDIEFWDDEEYPYLMGARFLPEDSVPPLDSVVVYGDAFTTEILTDGTTRSSIIIPPQIDDYMNTAVFIDDEQTVDYYIINGVLYIPRAVQADEKFEIFEAQPINGGTYNDTVRTAGMAEELVPLAPTENIVIRVTTGDTEYRVQQGPNREVYIERILDTGITTVATFGAEDTRITLSDASSLPPATLSNPETVWIGNERITYSGIDGNTLIGLQRGTRNTSRLERPAGTRVIYGGPSESSIHINVARPQETWYSNDSTSIEDSIRLEAQFLRGEI